MMETDLYQKIETENYPKDTDPKPEIIKELNGYKIVNAWTKTDDSGHYQFVGVVPGVYKIRFTYSDGTQYITDLDSEGNYTAVQENGENIDVNL